MSVIVTDTGFHGDDWAHGWIAPEAAAHETRRPLGIDLDCEADPSPLAQMLADIRLIRIRFPHYNESRGFDLARRLRAMGYRGRLRAFGHVLAHQYTLARRAGFDEVEISLELARRQPQEHWHFRGNWRHSEFHSRMANSEPA